MSEISLETVWRDLKCSSLFESAQKGGFDNPRWEDARGHYLIVRLSPFRDVVRSTSHLFLHRLLRSVLGPEAFIDFSFFPSKPDRRELEKNALPWLFGIQGRREAGDYSAILISCSYALELVNLPLLFLRSAIPLRSSERQAPRSDGSFWPLIILGGSNATASQSLLFPDGDSYVDGIYFGEGEDSGEALARALGIPGNRNPALRARDIERESPSFRATFGESGKRIRIGRTRISPAQSESLPLLVDRYPILNSEEASTARIQLSWGCPSFCSFCYEGYEHKPYRELDRETILRTARELAIRTGASTLELYSFNFNVHTDILSLILELNRLFERVNMMSQRADLLARVPGMLAVELAAEKRSFTVGVEGISDGMRAFYSKGLSRSDLESLLEKLAREKIRELKLFYILSGFETEEDIAEFSRFCTFLSSLRSSQDGALRALFSFGYLVRMPFTPLRGAPLSLDRKALEALALRLKTEVEGAGFEFRLAIDWDEYLADQILVLGGTSLAPGLESAAREGISYDLELSGNLRSHLEKALRAAGELCPGLPYRGSFVEAKDSSWPWPLPFLDTASSPAFLDSMLKKAFERRDELSCLGDLSHAKAARCLGCGACTDEVEKTRLTSHAVLPPTPRLAEVIAREIGRKRKMRPRYLQVRLPSEFSGWKAPFLQAQLLRMTLGTDESLVGKLLRVEEALWKEKSWGEGVTGEIVLSLWGSSGEDGQGNPALSEQDTEKARNALEQALHSPCRNLEVLPEIRGMDLSLELGKPLCDTDATGLVRAWISDLKLNAIERKTPTGRLFEIAPKDRKKRILEQAELFFTVNLQESERPYILPHIVINGGQKLDISLLCASASIVIEKIST